MMKKLTKKVFTSGECKTANYGTTWMHTFGGAHLSEPMDADFFFSFLPQKPLFPLPACFSILQLQAACKAQRSESDKHVERIQCKLTPCFRLSLAWSATPDTITKAATTQTEREGEIEKEGGTK